MTYQDKWSNGRLIEKGTRECAERYAIVKSFCADRFERAFTVCDIGANMCYFGIRLAEDFPFCRVVAYEFHSPAMRYAHLRQSAEARRISLVAKKLHLEDVSALALRERFDLVLALSVLHHLPGDSARWISALGVLGRHVIAEFALGDSLRTTARHNYSIPAGAKVLGYGRSHLDASVLRPIVALEGGK